MANTIKPHPSQLKAWQKVLLCSWQLAQQSHRAHRWRLWLSTIGIVVGTAALFSLWTLNRGVQKKLHHRLQAYGLNTLYQLPQENSLPTELLNAASEATYLTVEKLNEYKQSESVKPAPLWTLTAEARSHERHQNVPLVVSTSTLPQLLPIYIEAGRFLSASSGTAAVCVIGHRLAAALLSPEHPPIGQVVCIGNNCLTVIGVIHSRSNDHQLLPDLNGAIIVNPGTLLHRLLPFVEKNKLTHPLWISRYNRHTTEPPILPKLLKQLYPLSDYRSWNPESLVIEELKTQRTLRITLWGISLVAFIVGSIGMMNMIYSHAMERSSEIGIQKAVGATPAMIQWQYLLETLQMGFYGCLLGFLVGTLFSYFISQQAGIPWSIYLQDCIPTSLLALTISLLSAWLPARKAALLPPAQALAKHES